MFANNEYSVKVK